MGQNHFQRNSTKDIFGVMGHNYIRRCRTRAILELWIFGVMRVYLLNKSLRSGAIVNC